MPLVKSRPGCFKCLSWVILVENLDDSVPAHIKGREGNHLVGTQIRSLRVRVPFMGLRMGQLLSTPCVTSSLVVVVLGISGPTGGFHLWTLSIGGPTVIV
jgi:hypothetical protein